MTIKNDGNVGIGTTSPSSILDIVTSGGNLEVDALGISSTKIRHTTTGGILALEGDAGIRFDIDGDNEKARIDSDGRLLVGTSTALSNIYALTAALSPKLQIQASDNTAHASLIRTAGGGGSYFTLGWGSSGNVATTGQDLGVIQFNGFDGANYRNSASIICEADDAHASGDTPGRLVFSTTADGASSPTERMRIKQDGAVCAGTAETNWFSEDQKVVFRYAGTGACQLNIHDVAGHYPLEAWNTSSAAGARGLIKFRTGGAGSVVGSITTDGTNTTYATSSDYRLKENVVPLTGATDRLNQLQVRRFNFIADPDKTVDGFIAHEAQAVVPECATGTKDEVDANGNPVYQGIDQSKLVPLLTAALQEALAKIETLEQRLNDAGIA
jgi:hypothetical protein